ncbi:MAG: hypothetical protein ACREIA_01150 [Opitutaceae bacterium]
MRPALLLLTPPRVLALVFAILCAGAALAPQATAQETNIHLAYVDEQCYYDYVEHWDWVLYYDDETEWWEYELIWVEPILLWCDYNYLYLVEVTSTVEGCTYHTTVDLASGGQLYFTGSGNDGTIQHWFWQSGDDGYPTGAWTVEECPFSISSLTVDATVPSETKVNYSIGFPTNLNSLEFLVDGIASEVRNDVEPGPITFYFDQNQLPNPPGGGTTETAIVLRATFREETWEASRIVARREGCGSPDASELVSAYFLGEGGGLRLIEHKIINEFWDRVVYDGATYFGRTIFTEYSCATLRDPEDEYTWGEQHRYSTHSESTPYVNMIPLSGSHILDPNYNYREVLDSRWIEPGDATAEADVMSLFINIDGQWVAGAPISNSTVDTPLQ